MIYQLPFLISCLIIEIYAGCPTKCSCTKSTIDCVSKDLENVPNFHELETYPLIIDLSGNSLSIINNTDFSFEASTDVIEIYLNNSQLILIHEFAFCELENLQELYLNDNLLYSLPINLIEKNENMVLLHLSNNQFVDMPIIKSQSLELLLLANSGISRILPNALDDLPSLRMLVLSENNLKIINPATFGRVSSLFYIQVLYNPWLCDCKTVKLFDYLTEMKFVDLTEPAQCVQEGSFLDIYSDKGVAFGFERVCDDFDGSFDDEDEVTSENVLEVFKPLKKVKDEEVDQSLNNFYYGITLGCVVLVSLLIGAICGSCVTFKYLNTHMKQTDSTKELLNTSEKKYVPI